jgi:hypothetical protein
MDCVYNNPDLVAAAKAARQALARNAQTEEDYLAAAESTWDEFLPPCNCSSCAPANEPCPCCGGVGECTPDCYSREWAKFDDSEEYRGTGPDRYPTPGGAY